MLKIIIKVAAVIAENITGFWNVIDFMIFFYKESRRDMSQRKEEKSRPPPEV